MGILILVLAMFLVYLLIYNLPTSYIEKTAKGRIMSVRAKSALGYETSPDERGLFD